MITNFKIFELFTSTDDIEVGDYITLKSRRLEHEFDVIADNIGKVLRVRKHYDEIDAEFEYPVNKMFGISFSSIKYCSRNREDLEILLQSKKYNL